MPSNTITIRLAQSEIIIKDVPLRAFLLDSTRMINCLCHCNPPINRDLLMNQCLLMDGIQGRKDIGYIGPKFGSNIEKLVFIPSGRFEQFIKVIRKEKPPWL